ncbi:rCG57283 [Rattus norvegicus]|uniref:RCG57283 n=1 Tax=Rattus norvegicus TaxID=10116 RepID=A6JPA6_RAT|nr:rCG57283 [Rattus norvegicus]
MKGFLHRLRIRWLGTIPLGSQGLF